MVLNTTFNNISVISWWSGFIGWWNRSTRRKSQVASHWQTLLHTVSNTPRL